SASTLTWATLSAPVNGGTNGTRNEFNPYSIVDYSAGIKYTGGSVTFDQRLTKDISVFGEGFYGMPRARVLNNSNANQLGSFTVPTYNPYYPAGTLCTTNPVFGPTGAITTAAVPAGCTPTNLRVNYHMSVESPVVQSGGEQSGRYQIGLNVA